MIAVPVVTVSVVLVTVYFSASIRENRNFKRAFEAVSESDIHGKIVDRRCQRERQTRSDLLAGPFDAAVVAVTLAIVAAAAVTVHACESGPSPRAGCRRTTLRVGAYVRR